MNVKSWSLSAVRISESPDRPGLRGAKSDKNPSEKKLFQLVFERADRKDGTVVGVRHFTDSSCD